MVTPGGSVTHPFRVSTHLLIWETNRSTTLPLQASRGDLHCSESHKAVTIKTHESLSIHPYKAHGFPFTKYITFADNIRNTFIKSNKDHNIDPNTSTTYILPYSKPCISYIAVIINPTGYVFINTRFTHKFGFPKCGYAPSKALPLLEGSPPTNTTNQNTKT